MKTDLTEKDIIRQAERALLDVLARVPWIQVEEVEHAGITLDRGVDFEVALRLPNGFHRLACEVKAVGQPRFARSAVYQLDHYVRHYPTSAGIDATPVLIAPFLSSESRDLCREHGIGFVDFQGNCWLQFQGIYIERSGAQNSKPERRELRSVFSPKATQILRCMLREPYQFWRLNDLAEASHVSLGQVAKVKAALLAQEWGYADEHGFRLDRPDALLDAWREAYEPIAGQHWNFHTNLHGEQLERRLAMAVSEANDQGRAMLASFSAAKYLAPYARVVTQHLFADEDAVVAIAKDLDLRPVREGANITIVAPENRDIFFDRSTPMSGVVCTSPVQTYLDLYKAGDRGREAAEHLRAKLLNWTH